MVSGRPTVLNLRLDSRPDSAGLVRAVLGGIATPFALRPELVNDLKTVVSEACNNAVDHAYHGESGAIAVRVDIEVEEIEASVRDWGGGFQELAPVGDHLRVGLPLINALADRAEFLTAPGSGTEVRMSFDLRVDPRRTEMLVRSRVSLSLAARDQRIELTVGPLKPGSGERLQAVGPSDQDAPVAELADELAFETLDHCELLRVVLVDHERDLSSTRGQQ